MSNAPYYVYGMRNGVKLGDQTMVDGMIKDGLWCAFCDVAHGRRTPSTRRGRRASRGSSRTSSRPRSHRKAVAAIEAGKFKARDRRRCEIAGRKGPTIVDTDEGPRKDTTAETLAKLRPAFPAQVRRGRGPDRDGGQRVER